MTNVRALERVEVGRQLNVRGAGFGYRQFYASEQRGSVQRRAREGDSALRTMYSRVTVQRLPTTCNVGSLWST